MVLLRSVVAILTLTLFVIVNGSAGAELAAPPATTKQSIYYLVAPHPDDEYEGWAALDAYTAVIYPIFITLTQGEDTHSCTHAGQSRFEQAQGELHPSPSPWGYQFQQPCKDARLNSHAGFLAEYAQSVDPFLQGGAQYVATVSTAAGQAKLYAGSNYARAMFDAGDQNLTEAHVKAAIASVNQWRGTYFPNLPISRVVGASYSNHNRISGCYGYDHPDHEVVFNLMKRENLVPGVQQHLRTCSLDLAATYTGVVAADHHEAAWGVPAINGTTRLGAGQRHYGWLHEGAWPAPDLDTDLVCVAFPTDPYPGDDCHMFTRFQSYIVRG